MVEPGSCNKDGDIAFQQQPDPYSIIYQKLSPCHMPKVLSRVLHPIKCNHRKSNENTLGDMPFIFLLAEIVPATVTPIIYLLFLGRQD